MNKEKEFHESRLMFAVLDGLFTYQRKDSRSHKEWLRDLGYSDEDFENIVRGYWDYEKKIVLYIGKDFRNVPKNKLKGIQRILLDEMVFKGKYIRVYNGVIKGEIGTIWKEGKLIWELNN